MQRGRLLILVGLLLLVATLAVVYIISIVGPQPTETPTPGPEGATLPAPVATTKIVIAVLPLQRGTKIQTEALATTDWPENSLPRDASGQPLYFTDPKEIEGRLARYDIEPGSPVLSTLVTKDSSGLSETGSDAALSIPKDKVAITIPLNRLSGVGYALQAGDHINVLVSMLFVDLKESTQTLAPDQLSLVSIATDATTGSRTITFSPAGPEGTFSNASVGDTQIPFLVQPSEAQRPRLVVQQIVKDAVVLKIGTFTNQDILIAQPTATPLPEGTPPPPPTPVPPPDIITLIVTPQDAAVLTYYMFSSAKFTMVLRAAVDANTPAVDTEAVTLQYTIEKFRISVPTTLPYGLEPAIRTLKPPLLPNDGEPVLIPINPGYICVGANCP
jgi:Flp pilus assembly protein CpaB